MYDSGAPTAPFPRAGQAAVAISGGLIVIGGGGAIDIWKYKLQMVPWSGLDNSPSPRSRHASVMVGNKMLAFGGGDEESKDIILELDTASNKWNTTHASDSTMPEFCYGATAVAESGGGVLMHGGACHTPPVSQSNTFLYTPSMLVLYAPY